MGGKGNPWTPGGKSNGDGNAWTPGGKSNGGGEAAPDTNVFISDLPADVDDAKLQEVFAQYGTVTWSKVMASKGKPTSTAIVEFASIEEAKWVVENLSGNLAQGIETPLTLTFKRARSKGDSKGTGGYGKASPPAWGKAGKGYHPY